MEKPNNHINLDKLDKKALYDTPDGYFDRLPYAIQERIISNNSTWSQLSEMPLFVKLGSVTLVVFLLAFFYWSEIVHQNPTDYDLLAGVTDEEIIEYLYFENISTYEIMANFNQYDTLTLVEGITENWLDELSDHELENIYKNYDYDTSIQYY